MIKEQIALEMTKTIFESITGKKQDADAQVEMILKIYKSILKDLNEDHQNHNKH